jgi:hypothetical protein
MKVRISPPESLEFSNSFLLQDILVPQVRYLSTKLHLQEILLQLQNHQKYMRNQYMKSKMCA